RRPGASHRTAFAAIRIGPSSGVVGSAPARAAAVRASTSATPTEITGVGGADAAGISIGSSGSPSASTLTGGGSDGSGPDWITSHHTTTPIASANATAAANAGQTAWSRERRRSLTKSEGLAYGEVYPQATQEGLARRSEPVGDAYQDTRLRLDQV